MKTINTILILLTFTCFNCYAGIASLNHQIQKRDDRGFTIIISGTVQHLAPITAEGFFPKETVNCQIELKGEGIDWTYRNQAGFYYSYPENIDSKKQYWDIGYAWIDKNKEYIYLNFYWIKSPDSLEASQVNGKYKIQK